MLYHGLFHLIYRHIRRMKNLLLLFLSLFLVLGCSSSVSVQTKAVADHNKQLVAHLDDSTVAIMMRRDFLMKVMCTGVWIGPRTILTARHCVDEMGQLAFYRTYSDFADDNTMHEIYLLANTGLVKATDEHDDLALITSVDTPPKHSFVTIAKGDVYPSQKLHIIGNGGRLVFSYMPGYVSRIVKSDFPFHKTHRVIQVCAPVWYGDSGGGAFNTDGELVGISSFITDTPTVGFLVNTDEIRAFVKDNENF